MIKYHSVALFVKDINKAKHFYCDLLNIPVSIDMGRNVILEPGITLWEISEENIIAKTLGSEALSTGNKTELYFETDDIGAVEKMIRDNNLRLLHGIHEEPWGQKTIRFYDYDSNIIETGEYLSVFLKRMADSGLKLKEIADRTGMKPDDIEKIIR